jgi:hypothetical protein
MLLESSGIDMRLAGETLYGANNITSIGVTSSDGR